MARQFREQLEEKVQLEQARKAQRAATPPPVEPAPFTGAAAGTGAAPGAGAAPSAAPQGNDGSSEVIPGSFSPAQPADATGADPTAPRPAHAGGADEPRT